MSDVYTTYYVVLIPSDHVGLNSMFHFFPSCNINMMDVFVDLICNIENSFHQIRVVIVPI